MFILDCRVSCNVEPFLYQEPKRAKDGTQVRKGKPRVEAVEGNQVDQNSEIISSDMQREDSVI